jgi:hypothetical protein
VPQEVARQSRWGALSDTANQIARGFGTGNLDQAISGFAGGFNENLERRLGSGLDRQRQVDEDRLRREQANEALATARFSRARAGREAQWEEEDRTGKSQAIREMVREIEEIAGEDSLYTKRAKALFRGGPSLYGDIAEIHEQIAGLTEGADRAIDAKVKEKEALEQTPAEIERRKLERERADTYRRSIEQQGYGSPGGPTPTSLLSRVSIEASRLFEDYMKQAQGPYGLKQVTPEETAQIRERAEGDAMRLVQGRAAALGGEGGELGAATAPEPQDAPILSKARQAMARGANIELIQQGILEAVGGDAERARRILRALLGDERRGTP